MPRYSRSRSRSPARRSRRYSKSPEAPPSDCANIFCGNMNPTSNKHDLEHIFKRYGKIVDIWVGYFGVFCQYRVSLQG
ncbi:expressed unknown protein [Ectocarpus siliculosus]|uniref:RRM domain-containing protein n=1 Tax=Ectocarpus siliculosus TaxID=2880 RepID=D7FMT5_ECTSI|nr:expressed unknown protein [Ectocarpus siliculosus]|eukprot:CBJ30000.1 expressed unknown protein [Ectocarpus siliculosus]